MAKFKFIIIGLLCQSQLLVIEQLLEPAQAIPETHSSIGDGANSSSAQTVIDADKDSNKNVVTTTFESVIKADADSIWKTLTDFKKYPCIFKRIKSVEITKREGNLVYVESQLKSQIFVKKIVQHMVNDLSAGPKILQWRMLDGNFKYLIGKWELKPRSGRSCLVRYTLNVDVGPIVPASLTNFLVHHMQQEIVSDLKHYVEAEYNRQDSSNESSA